MRGKTGRKPLDSINREKRIHENPSHLNLTLDFIGSISKNRVFQRELIQFQNPAVSVSNGSKSKFNFDLSKAGRGPLKLPAKKFFPDLVYLV